MGGADRTEVLVVGCGVIGLSTSITLAQNGYHVTIWAKDLPPNTTSNKAAAVWWPYLAAPVEKVTKWASMSMEHYLAEAKANPSSGVVVKKTLEIFKVKQDNEPTFKDLVTVRRANTDELPVDYLDGFAVDNGIVADTDIYLDYLLSKAKELGIRIVVKEIKAIQETFENYDFVVNCTGLGSRELLKDNSIYPTRGQIVIVKNKEVSHAAMDDGITTDDLVYIIPRTNTTVLGGTAQANDWNIEPSQKDTEDILRKAKSMSPHFAEVEIVQVKVGLRPTRPTIRLEPEWFQEGKKLVIHNYGHGGSGFTLAWGCAQEVAHLLAQHNS